MCRYQSLAVRLWWPLDCSRLCRHPTAAASDRQHAKVDKEHAVYWVIVAEPKMQAAITYSTKTNSDTKSTPTASCVADWKFSDTR